jgi:hypothetical protein
LHNAKSSKHQLKRDAALATIKGSKKNPGNPASGCNGVLAEFKSESTEGAGSGRSFALPYGSGNERAGAAEGAFGADVDCAMLIKMYGATSESAKGRYSPAECIGAKKTPSLYPADRRLLKEGRKITRIRSLC